MKLIIQIPCFNEVDTLPHTFADLPRIVEGFDTVEVLIVDDGSTDGTAEVARSIGIDHIIRINGNQGLARAFMAGLNAAIKLDADIVVNTDADNQYQAAFISQLVRPLVEGRADIAIGMRPIRSIGHFTPTKKLLQFIGSWAVRSISGADVRDAPSGFRAMTREAVMRLNVFGRFSYTIETTIQAGLSNMRIVNIPIEVNSPTRPSRLFRSNFGYIVQSLLSMISVYIIYRPARLFAMLAATFIIPGTVLGSRYALLMAIGQGKGHVQSVIACATLAVCGFFMIAIGVLAHLQGINRRLLEEIRYIEYVRLRSDQIVNNGVGKAKTDKPD